MLDALDHLGMLKREYAQFYIGTNILIFYDNGRTMIHFLVSLRLGRVEQCLFSSIVPRDPISLFSNIFLFLISIEISFYRSQGALVEVMEYLQDKCIVYRDFKPENIMLDLDGYIKVVDFGLAKKLDEKHGRTFTMVFF